jgi:DHA2 family multidrug resistance protein-like MFS transporter
VVAGLLPGFGTLGDRHGHRRLFMAGLAAFGLASLLAAFAASALQLIIARAGLGVGAAMMMPATLAIIRDAFSDPRERSIAIGLWTGIASGGMALGPLVAGLLLTHFAWGSVFLINVPIVLLALLLTWLWVPARDAPGGPVWDLIGCAQIMVTLGSLVFAIQELARQDFSTLRLAIGLVLCVVSGVVYLRRQALRTHPLLDLTMFRLPGFSAAFAAACLGTAGAVGAELALSQYLQLVEQRAPLQAALVLLPVAIAGFIAGPLAGRLLHRISPVTFVCSAFLLAAACASALAFVSSSLPHFAVVRMTLLAGIGLGIGAAATFASSTIMQAADAARAGMAASIEEVGFELGNALGVAVFGSLMSFAYALSMTDWPLAVRDSLDAALQIAATAPADTAAALREAGRSAFTSALHAVLIGVGMLWMATALALIMRDPND